MCMRMHAMVHMWRERTIHRNWFCLSTAVGIELKCPGLVRSTLPPAILAVPPLLSKGNEECNFFLVKFP